MKASPLGSDWRFLLCLTLSHWEQRMQAKTWQSYPMLPLIAQTAPRRSGHTSWALAPASLEESPVQTETLLNILWFALDEISHQIPLLFMAKYLQATESNFYPFSFRHKFAVFKVETGSDGREKGRKKKKSFTSCENCPFNFHEKIERNVLLVVSSLIGVIDREHFLSPINSKVSLAAGSVFGFPPFPSVNYLLRDITS